MVDEISPRKLAKVLLDFGQTPGNFPVRLGEPRELHEQLNMLALWALGRIPEQLADKEVLLTDAARLFVRRACFAPDNTHYQVLGLTPNTFAPEDLRTRYRALIRLTHPDRGVPGLPGNAAGIVNRAHEVLSDPALRSRYDDQLADRSVPAQVIPQGAKFRRIEHKHGFADKWHSLKARYPKLVRLALSTAGVSAVAVGLLMWAAHDAQEGRMLVIAGSEPSPFAEQADRSKTTETSKQVAGRSQEREREAETAPDSMMARAAAAVASAALRTASLAKASLPEPIAAPLAVVAAAPSPAPMPSKTVATPSPAPVPSKIVAPATPAPPAPAAAQKPTTTDVAGKRELAPTPEKETQLASKTEPAPTTVHFSVDQSARMAETAQPLADTPKLQRTVASQHAPAATSPPPAATTRPTVVASQLAPPPPTQRSTAPVSAAPATPMPGSSSRSPQATAPAAPVPEPALAPAPTPPPPTRVAVAAAPPAAKTPPTTTASVQTVQPAAGPAWDVDAVRAKHYLIELISTLSSQSATQATNTYLAGMNVKGSLLKPALSLMQQYPDVSVEKMSWVDDEQPGVLQVRGEIVLLARSPQQVPRSVAYRLSAEFWGTKTGTVLATLSLKERE